MIDCSVDDVCLFFELIDEFEYLCIGGFIE